jgi:DNA-binding NarL/FixJ family response regulator
MVGALEAGASGYLTQRSSISDLVEATRGIQRGDVPLPPNTLASILETLTQKRGRQDQALEGISRLTPREREVLALLAQGQDKATIARRLVISPETVRTHFQNILVKLEVHSRLEAAAFVRRNHLMQELVPNKERPVRDSAAANARQDRRTYS